MNASIFPLDIPSDSWQEFQALGYDCTVFGVIYRKDSRLTNGMPLGGIDTGCIDLENTGLLGYCTIFNTHVPRRGPINLPLFGLSVDHTPHVLCHPEPKDGEGGSQQSVSGRPYNLWRGDSLRKETRPITPINMQLDLEDLSTPNEIHYWGHYPIVDLQFEIESPFSVGLRAWSPFLPGHLQDSIIPGIAFEFHLKNQSEAEKQTSLALSFPGPTEEEAGGNISRREHEDGRGLDIEGQLASYTLRAASGASTRTGAELGCDPERWSRFPARLPTAKPGNPGSTIVQDCLIKPGQEKILKFILTWYAPKWNAGGYNWARAGHEFKHMYARYSSSSAEVARRIQESYSSLLNRIISWQKVIYTESDLPPWLRDGLINVLHLITEDGMWAQAAAPLPNWVKSEDGLFGMNECPRGCPQIECIPCSFYGNQPIVYFFPRLALSTLRGYRGYQYPDGAPPWIFGGCTAGTPPIDFANPSRGYQFATNGISLATMIDRYRLCHDDPEFNREFYPAIKASLLHSLNLRTAESYSMGERAISMPDLDSEELQTPPTEWFEAPKPGWRGMTAHLAMLRLAELAIVESMALEVGDRDFSKRCRRWIKEASEAMEDRLWTGSYYLNYLEPETGEKSDLIFGYQLDGECIIRHHGLGDIVPVKRIRKTLDTIREANLALSRDGAVNYASDTGHPVDVGGYGTYSYFPPEALMLAMTYIYHGQEKVGMELARGVWHNIVCKHGYTWDMPNIMRGDEDTGERKFGNDYYQDMMLWSLPAAIKGADFGEPVRKGGLASRIISATRP